MKYRRSIKASLSITMLCDEGQWETTTDQSRQDYKCPDLSGMKVWVTPPGKKPQSAEVLAEGKVNTEWVVEEGSHQYQL